MLTSLLPVAVTLIPFAIVIFFIYHFISKKAGKITGLIFGLGVIILIFLILVLFGGSPSKTEDATISAGEKTISQLVEETYPGAHYSVEGKVKTSGELRNEYHIKIAAEYNEADYLKFNKDACIRLKDNSAGLITTISEDGLSKGKGGSCEHWLNAE